MMGGTERLGLAAAVGATLLGLAFLAAAGAPMRYLSLNAVALAIGLAGFFAIRAAPWRIAAGDVALAMAALLLATALFGVRVEGASRWLFVGGLSIQPSLILLPALCVLCARGGDTRRAAIAVAMASAAMALQPDRAMAAALASAMLVAWLARRERRSAAMAAVAAIGFAVTLARPDALPAVPFVDRILFTGFALSPLAGIAVWAGAALLVLPAITGTPAARVHGAVWATIVAAAALGNYPTPVVGYGSSAIIGYLLALAALPGAPGRRPIAGPRRAPDDAFHPPADLRVAR